MSLFSFIFPDAAREWFRELSHSVGIRPQLAPDETAAKLDSFGKVMLAGRLREANRRLSPTAPPNTLVTFRETLLPSLLNGALCIGAADDLTQTPD